MIRTYRYRIYPTPEQEKLLKDMQFAVFKLYNDSLRAIRETYYTTGEILSKYELAKYWTRVCQQHPEFVINLLPNDTRQRVLDQLDESYKAFFKWAKSKKAGAADGKRRPPKFRRLKETTSIAFRGRTIERFREYHRPGGEPCVYIQAGVGEIKTVYHRPLPNSLQRITWATVNEKQPGKWYVSLTCEFDHRELPELHENAIGIDVGLNSVIAASDGTTIDMPGFLREQLQKLRRLQRHLDRQRRANNPQNYNEDGTVKRGVKWHKSTRMKKTEDAIRRTHAKIAEQRKYFWHQITDELTRYYDFICIEDLSLRFMQTNNRLARDTADAAIGMFWLYLEQKASERYCVLVKVPPAYTSQTCSECGHVEKHNRKGKSFKCKACGYENDADVNAARNILSRGVEQYRQETPDLQTG